jgi:DNA-3-methyladenine glycosylase
MEARRKRKGTQLSNGPAKLCQALGIDKSLNGWDLTRGKELWVEDYRKILVKSIITSPRIGIDYAEKEHRDAPWRFLFQF